MPTIDFETIDSTFKLKEYDFLIFTSKQAVKSLNNINKDWVNIPSISIGRATSNTIVEFGGTIEHEPMRSNAKSLVEDIIKRYSNKKILYLRAKEVSLDIKEELSKYNIEIDQEIVYSTNCISHSSNLAPSDGAVIIFTSPSTIDCFLKSFTWNSSYIAVSVGNNTDNHLPSYVTSYIANEPTIGSCIEKATEVSNSK